MSDLNKVKELRKATGAGFKDCNNALKEADGNLDKAIEILRVKGISKASKKMSRSANEGVIVFSENKKNFSLIEINCETDFVAKNDDFIKFAKELSDINVLVESNLDKLKNQKMNNGISVEENLLNLISKIGEKITIGRLKTISNENVKNFKYLHTVVKDNLAKLGVLLSIETSSDDSKIYEFGKQLCMHIAALNPLSLKEQDLDIDTVNNEKMLVDEELKNSGKPKDIIEKIAEGKIKKFKQDNCLLSQDWVLDPKKKVQDVINELKVDNFNIKSFYRIKIGE
tara:strand:- start:380 stop:1231 length:852 start_codon:yes stop_codon:yes gene_type:complete